MTNHPPSPGRVNYKNEKKKRHEVSSLERTWHTKAEPIYYYYYSNGHFGVNSCIQLAAETVKESPD